MKSYKPGRHIIHASFGVGGREEMPGQEARRPGGGMELANKKGGSGAKAMSSEHLSASPSVFEPVVPSQNA